MKLLIGIILIVLLLLTLSLFGLSTDALQYYVLDESRHVTIVAVSQLPNGSYTGVTADLYVRVVCPGGGHVYVETFPLAEIDLQASTRVAAIVASIVANVSTRSCDFYASIRSDSPIVGGPSASGVTAVAFAAALLRLPLNESIVMTGMIMPDGSIGPVGGVYYKLQAAISRGAKMFLVPYGQTVDVMYTVIAQRVGPVVVYRTVPQQVNLTSYGAEHGVIVKPVANIYEALSVFTNRRFSYSVGGYEEAVKAMYSSIALMLKNGINDMKKEISRVMNLSKSVERLALSTSSAYYLTQLLKSIDSSLSSYISLGSNLEAQNKLYAAASTYFQALIYAYWRLHLLNAAIDSNYISNAADEVKGNIHDILKNVWSLIAQPLDVSRLSIFINTVDRLYEALIYANKSMASNRLDSATQYLAIASARVFTAKFWLRLLNSSVTSTSIVITPSDLEELSITISSLARNIYSYIIAFSSQTAIPQDLFSEAQARYNLMLSVNTAIDRIALGISSLSYMYLTLLYTFMLSESTSLVALNKTIEASLTMLKSSIPPDIPLLLELCNTGITEARLYNTARLSMLLSTYIILEVEAKTLQGSPATLALQPSQCINTPITITTTTTVTITLQHTYIPTTSTSGVGEGLHIIIIIVFVILILIVLLRLLRV